MSKKFHEKYNVPKTHSRRSYLLVSCYGNCAGAPESFSGGLNARKASAAVVGFQVSLREMDEFYRLLLACHHTLASNNEPFACLLAVSYGSQRLNSSQGDFSTAADVS